MTESSVSAHAALPRLRNAYVHVTKECNLRCNYCYFSASRPLPDELTRQEFALLWPQLAALRSERVIMTGGEPFMRADVFDLLSDLNETPFVEPVVRCLNTNGYSITPTVAQRLVGLVDEVRVSLDGLPGTHDRLRGEGSFEVAAAALETLYSVGFEPKVLVTVTSISLPDLERLIDFLVARKLTRIKLNMFREIGRGAGRIDLHPPTSDLDAALARIAERLGYARDTPTERDGFSESGCGVGQHVNVMPNGDVFPCHALTSSGFCCGNLRHVPLASMFDSTGVTQM